MGSILVYSHHLNLLHSRQARKYDSITTSCLHIANTKLSLINFWSISRGANIKLVSHPFIGILIRC